MSCGCVLRYRRREQLLAWAVAWPERTWAIEGAGGLGHLLAQQLLAAGERVLDVQPKLGARVRLLANGAVNKNDPNDARSVAVAALRSPARREVQPDDHAAVLKVWSKRHRDLGRTRTQIACRLHAVLCELIPGGVSKEITAAHAAQLLESITPAGAVEAARCELAAAFLDDLRRIDAQLLDAKKKLTVAVRASGTTLTEICGVGPVVAGHRDRRRPRRVPLPRPGSLRRLQRHRTDRGVLRQPQNLPAVTAREPAPQPRHPHGRRHPDPLPPQPRPRLLRPQARRGQDPQRGTPRSQAPRSATPSSPASRPTPAGPQPAHIKEPGRAAGERLCRQRGRLTPQAPALRPSHSRTHNHPTTASCGRGKKTQSPLRGKCYEALDAKRHRYARRPGMLAGHLRCARTIVMSAVLVTASALPLQRALGIFESLPAPAWSARPARRSPALGFARRPRSR